MTASLEWNISLVDRIIGSPLDEMEWWDVNRWFFNSFKFWLPFDSHNSWRCFWAYFLIYHCLLRLLWKRKAPKTTNRLWTGKKTAVSHNFQNPKLNTSFITQKCLWNLPLKRCVFFQVPGRLWAFSKAWKFHVSFPWRMFSVGWVSQGWYLFRGRYCFKVLPLGFWLVGALFLL